MTYSQQLKHPNWQRRRLEMLERADWQCSECGCKESTLHVHHKRYVKGRMAWEYSNEELVVLCEDCHAEEHCIVDDLKELISVVRSTQSLALLRGFHANSDWFDPMIGDMGRDREPLTYAIGFAASLLDYLNIDQIHEVARFAVSLTSESSEARMILPANSYIFGEDE